MCIMIHGVWCMGNKIDLSHLDCEYFRKQGKSVRKYGTLLDSETNAILQEIEEDRNPFDIQLDSKDISKLDQSKFIRASIKAMKENPVILKMVIEEIGVENL